MELKILVTGRNEKVISDLQERLVEDKGYEVVKCEPADIRIFDILLDEEPDIAILCLSEENADTVKQYDILNNGTHKGNCITIVIANEGDEKAFLKCTKLDKAYLLARPVSLDALYDKLESLEAELSKEREQNLTNVREFVNLRNEKESHKKHILVVDDDTDQLLHIREQLREFYDVSLVKSGNDAFRFLAKKTPDLILLDYLMPEKDGSDVAKELRSNPEYAEIPIVFLTGMTEKSAIIDILAELKPQGFIIKPVKKSELVAKIIDVLG